MRAQWQSECLSGVDVVRCKLRQSHGQERHAFAAGLWGCAILIACAVGRQASWPSVPQSLTALRRLRQPATPAAVLADGRSVALGMAALRVWILGLRGAPCLAFGRRRCPGIAGGALLQVPVPAFLAALACLTSPCQCIGHEMRPFAGARLARLALGPRPCPSAAGRVCLLSNPAETRRLPRLESSGKQREMAAGIMCTRRHCE